jgi:hypothetical protein
MREIIGFLEQCHTKPVEGRARFLLYEEEAW